MAKNQVSGKSSYALFAVWNLNGSSWRMFQSSGRGGSKRSRSTWPRAGTYSRGLVCEAPMLEPLIDESVCSLLPTPVVSDTTGAARGQRAQGGPKLSAIALLPTPTATDYGSGNNGSPGDGKRVEYATKGAPSLSRLSRQLPTPTAGDARGSRREGLSPGSNAGVTLTDAAQVPERYAEAVRRWEQVLGRAAPPMASED